MRLLIFVALMFSAGMAQALSCLQPDVADTFQRVHADEAHWNIVVGRLDFDDSRLPKNAQDTDLRAQLVGHALGLDGWNTPYQRNVTLRVTCAASWCGQPRSGMTYMAFIKHEGTQRVVFAEPCGGLLFAKPSKKDRARVLTCLQGGPCAPLRN